MKVYRIIINLDKGELWEVWSKEPVTIADIKRGDRWNYIEDFSDGMRYCFQGRSLESINCKAFIV